MKDRRNQRGHMQGYGAALLKFLALVVGVVVVVGGGAIYGIVKLVQWIW